MQLNDNLNTIEIINEDKPQITIVKTIELLIYKWNVCAYTLWSVLEINTSFRRHQRGIKGLRRIWINALVEETPLLLFSSVSSPGFGFLGSSRPDLVMHRMDDVDMQFLGLFG